jgi:hypothetical protein
MEEGKIENGSLAAIYAAIGSLIEGEASTHASLIFTI